MRQTLNTKKLISNLEIMCVQNFLEKLHFVYMWFIRKIFYLTVVYKLTLYLLVVLFVNNMLPTYLLAVTLTPFR